MCGPRRVAAVVAAVVVPGLPAVHHRRAHRQGPRQSRPVEVMARERVRLLVVEARVAAPGAQVRAVLGAARPVAADADVETRARHSAKARRSRSSSTLVAVLKAAALR